MGEYSYSFLCQAHRLAGGWQKNGAQTTLQYLYNAIESYNSSRIVRLWVQALILLALMRAHAARMRIHVSTGLIETKLFMFFFVIALSVVRGRPY